MTRGTNTYFRLAGLGLFVAVLTTALPQSGFGQKPPVLQAPLDVQVVNPTVPVSGSVGVTGTVAATQSGPWNVAITGTPTVSLGGQTQLLDRFSGTIVPSFNEVASATTTAHKTIRVVSNCFVGATCGNVLVRIYTIVESRSYLLEQFPMQSFVADTRVYDVPGQSIAVQLVNNTGGNVENVGVAIFGRTN